MNQEQTEAIDQELIDVAMSIIMDAGDARLVLTDCFNAIAESDFKKCEEKMAEARKLLAQAHGQQTSIIQSESEGVMRQHPLLFIHAQDTLMTINTEMNLCRQMLSICRKYEARIAALEERR